MICEYTVSANGMNTYEDPEKWKGMAFRSAKRGGTLIPFEKVLEKHCKVASLLEEY